MTKSVGTSYPFSSNNARSYQVPHVSNTSGNEYISPANLPGSTIKRSTSLSPSSSSISSTQDRKSTRLNSSHVAISYAVLCLKKKTTHLEETGPLKEKRR